MPALDIPAYPPARSGSRRLIAAWTSPPSLWIALTADVSVAAFLIWGVVTSPGGAAGLLHDDSLLRLLLTRVMAFLAVALGGTWLSITERRLGGVFLTGAAIGSAFTIPSAFWAVPAILLGAAGACALTGSVEPRGVDRNVRRGVEALGLALAVGAAPALAPCAVVILQLGQSINLVWSTTAFTLLPLGTIAVVGSTAALNAAGALRAGSVVFLVSLVLSIVGASADGGSPLVGLYEQVPGARPTIRLGDATIPIPPREPEYALTPVPVTSAVNFSVPRLDLTTGQTTTLSFGLRTSVPVDAFGFDLDYDPSILAIDDIAVGSDMREQATANGLGVLTLPGVVADNAGTRAGSAALTNAGVGILTSGHTDPVGPTSGTVGILTVRAIGAGSTHLAFKSATLYSWVDGVHRHHQAPNLPSPVTVSVANQ